MYPCLFFLYFILMFVLYMSRCCWVLFLLPVANLLDALNKSSDISRTGISGGSGNAMASALQDDGAHPVGKDDSISWTTATVQQPTSSQDAVLAGSDDAFSVMSTTSDITSGSPSIQSQSETMEPIDSFLTPASSSICTQQDYEILKASRRVSSSSSSLSTFSFFCIISFSLFSSPSLLREKRFFKKKRFFLFKPKFQ